MVIGVGVSLAVILCITTLVVVVIRRKKASSLNGGNPNSPQGIPLQHLESYIETLLEILLPLNSYQYLKYVCYDMIGHDKGNEDHGNIYGDVNDDLEFQTVQNPYYGGEEEIDINTNITGTARPDTNNTEVVTLTKNDYYEM